MNRAFLSAWVALGIAAAAPGLGLAQVARLDLTERPPAFHLIDERLDRLSSRIDRQMTHGWLARTATEQAHREINGMKDQLNADREQHGGRITVPDRFYLQARIDRLEESLRIERVNVANPRVG